MKPTIFFSWQSDLPNKTNRNLIQEALESAVCQLKRDPDIEVEPAIDRDTAGVPGAPDIAQTIFQKIKVSSAFVADISFIGTANSRSVPNPNVLIELGYALHALGEDKVIPILNSTYGPPEGLPFDLKMRRAIVYQFDENGTDKASVKKDLSSKLAIALKYILQNVSKDPETPSKRDWDGEIKKAFQTHGLNPNPIYSDWVDDFYKRLASYAPVFSTSQERDETLISSIDSAMPLVEEFASIARTTAQNDSKDGYLKFLNLFAKILSSYFPNFENSGSFNETDFDYFKFFGHELFILLVGAMLEEDRLESLGYLCEQPLHAKKHNRVQDFNVFDLSEHLKLLIYRNQRLKLNRVSLHSDLLEKHFKEKKINNIVPFNQVLAADFFLYLKAAFTKHFEQSFFVWRPWTSLYLREAPIFLRKAQWKNYFERLRNVMPIFGDDSFGDRLSYHTGKLERFWSNAWYDSPLEDFDTSKLGTK